MKLSLVSFLAARRVAVVAFKAPDLERNYIWTYTERPNTCLEVGCSSLMVPNAHSKTDYVQCWSRKSYVFWTLQGLLTADEYGRLAFALRRVPDWQDRQIIELAFANLDLHAKGLKVANDVLKIRLASAAADYYRLQGWLHPKGLLEQAEFAYTEQNAPRRWTRLKIWEVIMSDKRELCSEVAAICKLKADAHNVNAGGKVKTIQVLAAEFMEQLYTKTSERPHTFSPTFMNELVFYKDVLTTPELQVLVRLCEEAGLFYVVRTYRNAKLESTDDDACQ